MRYFNALAGALLIVGVALSGCGQSGGGTGSATGELNSTFTGQQQQGGTNTPQQAGEVRDFIISDELRGKLALMDSAFDPALNCVRMMDFNLADMNNRTVVFAGQACPEKGGTLNPKSIAFTLYSLPAERIEQQQGGKIEQGKIQKLHHEPGHQGQGKEEKGKPEQGKEQGKTIEVKVGEFVLETTVLTTGKGQKGATEERHQLILTELCTAEYANVSRLQLSQGRFAGIELLGMTPVVSESKKGKEEKGKPEQGKPEQGQQQGQVVPPKKEETKPSQGGQRA